jgi:hypothetical protein
MKDMNNTKTKVHSDKYSVNGMGYKLLQYEQQLFPQSLSFIIHIFRIVSWEKLQVTDLPVEVREKKPVKHLKETYALAELTEYQ